MPIPSNVSEARSSKEHTPVEATDQAAQKLWKTIRVSLGHTATLAFSASHATLNVRTASGSDVKAIKHRSHCAGITSKSQYGKKIWISKVLSHKVDPQRVVWRMILLMVNRLQRVVFVLVAAHAPHDGHSATRHNCDTADGFS